MILGIGLGVFGILRVTAAPTVTTIGANISTGGNLTVGGNIYASSTLLVDGVATFNGNTSLGTVVGGTWHGTAISTQYGGLGQNFSGSTGLISFNSGTASAVATSSLNLTVSAFASPNISQWTNNANYLTNALTKGYFLVGSDAGAAQATSSIFVSSTGLVGIGTTNPRTKLDVIGRQTIVASVTAPTDAAGSITYGSGDYQNYGVAHNVRVYAYKNISGGRLYSSTYATLASNLVDNGGGDDTYYITWSWTAASGADGYRILEYDDYNITHNYSNYYDTTNTSFNDGDGSMSWTIGNNVLPNGSRQGALKLGYDNTNYSYFDVSSNGSLNILSGAASTGISLNSSGNVGIGTTNPIAQLHVAGSVPTLVAATSTGVYLTYSIYVQGNYAYVEGGGFEEDGSLQIFDVSDPGLPTRVGSATTGIGANNHPLYVQGKYAYVLNPGDNTLQIFDVSNPSSPTSVATVATAGWGLSVFGSVYVQGKYAYVVFNVWGESGSNKFLQIFDVSNPSSPTSVATTTIGHASDSLYVQGRYAYVGEYGSLQIFDVSNPSSPTSVASIASTGADGIFVQGRYAYAVGNSNLQIFDVSNPSAPTSVATTTTAEGSNSIYVQGRYAYVGGSSNLQIFDVSNPSLPTSVATIATNPSFSIYVQGRYAYVVGPSLFQIFDLGGAYIQQLEAGGIEAGTLSLRNNLQVNNDADIRGGLNIGNSLEVTGASGIYASSSLAALTINQSGAGYGAIIQGGNVGIGTSSPQALLTVGSSTSAYLAAGEKYNSLYVSGLMEVGGPGTSTIANNLYVMGTLRSHASYIGDLFFGNNFSITESANDAPTQELIFKNQNNEEILKLDENGNLTIKGSLNNTPAENSSSGLFGDIIQSIKDGLSQLTGVIQVAGEWVFDKITANNVETQNIQSETGVTTKDQSTGEYYCMMVKNGQVTSQKGKCGDQNIQNIELPQSPSPSSDQSSGTPPIDASTSTTPTTTPTIEENIPSIQDNTLPVQDGTTTENTN